MTMDVPHGGLCFYCSGPLSGSEPPEHVLPAGLGVDLTTRRVCQPCNQRAGREVDQPWLSDYLVNEARVRLQVPDRRGNPPRNMTIPAVSGDGRDVFVHLDGTAGSTRIELKPQYRSDGIHWTTSGYTVEATTKKLERMRQDHADVRVVRQAPEAAPETAVASIVQPPQTWPRFGAKVALAVASLVCADDWLESANAKALQEALWSGPADGLEPGVAWCSIPAQLPNALPMRPPEHLLTHVEWDGIQWLGLIIFAELQYRVPLEIDWGEAGPQSWWFSPDNRRGRQLPADVQLAQLMLR
jgi:hypothetical protein